MFSLSDEIKEYRQKESLSEEQWHELMTLNILSDINERFSTHDACIYSCSVREVELQEKFDKIKEISSQSKE